MKLHRVLVLLGAAAWGTTMCAAAAVAQSRPTIAVLYFNNAALGKSNAELAPLAKGMADPFETGQIEFVTDGKDKPDNRFPLVHKVAARLNAGLKLPEIPKPTDDARALEAERVPWQAVMLYSRALNAKDAGRRSEAVALFRQILEKYPEYEPAKRAKLGS